MTFKVLLHHYGRFTIPPGRNFVDGLVATVDPVELDSFSTNQVKLILTNSLGYDFNSPTFLYLRNPNCSLDSGLISLANAIGNEYHTKGRKTKPKTTKLGTEWKSVKRRSQIEAKKSIKSKSQQKSQTVKVKRKSKSEEI
ncbi:hypothetical protein Tco_0533871 [Tanacetum coccineum]